MGLIIDSFAEKVTLASLFDGIGGAPLCAAMCGAVPVWASEIEAFPIKVTQLRFPNMKQYGDITRINGAEVEPVDIIVGGSPCQDLSVAGKRAGLKHGDFGDEEVTRSGLFMEQIRIVREMRNATNGTKPRFMVWENVPGAFSSAGGEDFRAVLEETARIADPTVSIPRSPEGWANSGSILGEGFSISWRTVDAQYWGVPQRRRRIYLVADFGGESAPEILFESEGLPWHFEKGGSKGQGTAGEVENRIRTAGGSDVTSTLFAAYGTKWNGNSGADTGDHFVIDNNPKAAGFKGCAGVEAGLAYNYEIAPTLLAGQESHVHILPFNTTQITSPQNGNNPNYGDPCHTLAATGPAYGLVSKGNGEAFLMEEKHMALGCGGGQAGQGYPAVMVQPQVLPFNTADRHAVAYGICSDKSNSMLSDNPRSGIYEAETARTIDQNGGNPACNQGGIVVLDMNKFNPSIYRAGGFADYIDGEVGTLKSSGGDLGGGSENLITYQDVTGPLMANTHPGSYSGQDAYCDMFVTEETTYQNVVGCGDCCISKGTSNQLAQQDMFITKESTVRRLTPLECERLQGYPDFWTDIPGATDSPRYKSLGNSFAIPNAYFVISGCVEQIRKAASK